MHVGADVQGRERGSGRVSRVHLGSRTFGVADSYSGCLNNPGLSTDVMELSDNRSPANPSVAEEWCAAGRINEILSTDISIQTSFGI